MSRRDIVDEEIHLRTNRISVSIKPRLGGKIASISMAGIELLQAPLKPYSPRTKAMAFSASDASGWDECVPSVAACRVKAAAGTVSIPDHGDLWRVEWRLLAANAETVTLVGECFSLPLVLERSLRMSEHGNSSRLILEYKFTNIGDSPAPWSWSAHPLFAVEARDRILLPETIHALRVEASGGDRLGPRDGQVAWPMALLPDGSRCDLSVAQPPATGIGDKLYAGPLNANENWCALERYSAGVRIRMAFDPAATPYLGLWLCYGGWPEGDGAKQACIALEPTTAPRDSLAHMGPWSRSIAPGESVGWHMHVDFDLLA